MPRRRAKNAAAFLPMEICIYDDATSERTRRRMSGASRNKSRKIPYNIKHNITSVYWTSINERPFNVPAARDR